MHKAFLAVLLATPLLTLSAFSHAAEPATPATEVVQLSEHQMDNVTAGWRHYSPRNYRASYEATIKQAYVYQVNNSPVSIVQIGNGNTAIVYSGNFSSIFQ